MADVLEAAAELFAQLGYAATTTNKIARRAGVSIGSLYQYFSNKDEVLSVLLEEHQAEVRSAIAGGLERLADHGIPLRDALRHLLRSLLDLHAKDPALSRVLSHVLPSAAGNSERRATAEARYVEEVAAILRERPDVAVGDARLAASVVVQSVGQLMRWLGHEAPPSVDADAFLEALLEMITRYLAPSSTA